MPFTTYDKRLEHENAKQYAYRTLRQNILLLDMLPGEIVAEKDVSASLQVSRTPVREALLELARERLIDIFPQRGTKVALLDNDMVGQGRFLRSIVELAVLELDCKGGIPPEHLAALEENLAEQAQLIASKDIIGFLLKDNGFHQILFNACGKDMVFDAVSLFLLHSTREQMLRLQMFDPCELMSDHQHIAEGVRNRDLRIAQLHMKRHLDREVCDQRVLKEAYPSYFTVGRG